MILPNQKSVFKKKINLNVTFRQVFFIFCRERFGVLASNDGSSGMIPVKYPQERLKT